MSTTPLILRRSTRLTTTAVAVAGSVRRRSLSSQSLSSLSALSSDDDNPRPAKRPRIRKITTEASVDATQDELEEQELTRKPRRKRRADIPEPGPEDFAPRAQNTWKIGPHVSSAGGVENAIINAASVGANAFAIFLKSQRKWDSNALKDESIAKFKERLKAFNYSPSHILPHGSYLVNLGNPDEEKREKSYKCFLDDLKRCEQLGLRLYNFHPGSTVGAGTMEESLSLIAECINRAHKETESVVIVLENMAGSGNVIGSRFSELGNIIKQVDDKTRVGVCLDTCHMYAAGYDITTQEGWQATMDEFERDVGMQYLRGMHLNDSKAALGSKKDRHENIGLGHLGLATFARILADPRTRGIPLILETPAYDVPSSGSAAARERLAAEGMGVWRAEVGVLNRISGRGLLGEGHAEGEGVGENEMEEMRREIEDAVKKASKLRDAKGKKVDGEAGAKTKGKANGKGKGKKAKRKKGAVDEDEEAEEDEVEVEEDGGGDSCCESEH
ncbi:AP endonuclease [Trametes cingulata]|nr:AP endonuclease [Trametes cingulata]